MLGHYTETQSQALRPSRLQMTADHRQVLQITHRPASYSMKQKPQQAERGCPVSSSQPTNPRTATQVRYAPSSSKHMPLLAPKRVVLTRNGAALLFAMVQSLGHSSRQHAKSPGADRDTQTGFELAALQISSSGLDSSLRIRLEWETRCCTAGQEPGSGPGLARWIVYGGEGRGRAFRIMFDRGESR